jgi:hypothetical protein
MLRLVAAFAVAVLGLLAIAPGHSDVARAAVRDGSTSCPSETTSCVNQPFPCAASCSVSAGPVTNLGQNQAVYVDVSGIRVGDDVGLAMCSLAQGVQVQAYPTCASSIPPPKGCVLPGGGACPNTASALEWQFGQVTSPSTVLSIGTEYDPNIPDATPITSQTSQQFGNGDYGSFFCDNAADRCGVEVTDIPGPGDVIGNGSPPRATFTMTAQNTVVIPVTFSQGGNGCESAPVMQVDSAYSAAQFLTAGGAATCTASGGVAVIPTDLPSVDDSGCSSGSGTHCPITDVIKGNVPATFTDDPEDASTLTEIQQAGGKLAYIPIAVSSTEIAFLGEAGASVSGLHWGIPLSSYQLTAAQAAGIMTQTWNNPIVQSSFAPQDDLCAQMSASGAKCTLNLQSKKESLLVDTVNGNYENVYVDTSSSGVAKSLPFTTFSFNGNFTQTGQLGTASNFAGDTAFALLNPWPSTVSGNVPVNETTLGAMFPSTASGSIYQLTGWMCGAPQVDFPVTTSFTSGTSSFHDITSSQQLLSNAENGPLVVTKNSDGSYTVSPTVDQNTTQVASKCLTLSTLPTDFGGTAQAATDNYLPSSSPLSAAHVIQGALAAYSGSGGFAFTAMDSSEADFYGLLPASLQNAAGKFVPPNPTSVLAALNDETANPDGTLSPNFGNTSDTNAYPMPMVTYALVSTGDQPTMTQAQQLKDMLTNLVAYSHTVGVGSSNPLPSGYVPLPDNLYQQATAEIAKDIVGPGGVAPPPPGSSSGAGSPGSSGSAGSAGGTGGVASAGHGTSFHFNSGTKGSAAEASGAPGSGGGAGSGGTGDFLGRLITVTLGDSRFFIPGLLLLALLCLICGPLLYMSPSLRRAHAGGDGFAGEEGATAGDGAVDGPGPVPPEPGPDG